jgi:hypothetical protein
MKWYVFMLFLLVGFVWSVSAQQAQQMDPKLAGTWESHDAGCNPCTLTIQPNGQFTFAQAGSDIQIVFSHYTPAPGIDLVFQRGGKANLKLSKNDKTLMGFYTPPTRAESYDLVVFDRK